MSRTAAVARTAHDLKHGNHLRAPVYGVTKIALKVGKTASKSHLPDGAPAGPQEKGASDDFHFAPVKEKLKIVYKIDDAAGCITKAKLELFRRKTAKAIWTVDLKEEEFTDGEHEREWDGKITKDAKEFPEECVTVQHSPYKLKITLEGKDGYGFPLMAWTFFHILVHEIELELGPKKVLPTGVAGTKAKRDEDLYDTLGALPKRDAKAPLEVNLVSNIYSIGGVDDQDQTWFNAYQAAWGEGPDIPVFAKLYVRNSSDKKEEVPEAIGTIRLLWDWKDEKEDLSMHFKEGKEFLKDTLDFDQKTSKPPGDNCFGSATAADDRGGKRGITTAARIVYPAHGGDPTHPVKEPDHTFPFKVEQCTTRKWCSYSSTWPTGEFKGKTGVLFEPARMAGDNYRVMVYCAHKREPDGKDNLDTEDNDFLKQAVKNSTGIFQIWREIHLVKYLKKAAAMAEPSLATVSGNYRRAYTKLVDNTGARGNFPTYDADLRAQLVGKADQLVASIETGNQGTITSAGVRFRTHAAFVTALETARVVPVGGLGGPGGWLVTNGFDTPAGYQGQLEAFTDAIVPQSLRTAIGATPGITICQFNKYWDVTGSANFSGTSGFADTNVPNTNINHRAYLLSFGPAEYAAIYPLPSINNMELTTTHEIGHCCFLPHASHAGGNIPALHDDYAHWDNCTMSYHYNKRRQFCGLCMLRLRGWKAETVPPAAGDPTNMKSARASNKR